LKCVGYGELGGRRVEKERVASRNARKSGYLKGGSRDAMAVHTGGRRLHRTMNAGRIAAVGAAGGNGWARGRCGRSDESILIKITRAREILRRFARSLCAARNDYAAAVRHRTAQNSWHT